MQFGMWDALFNALLLALWFRLWNPDTCGVLFNPYLLPLCRLTDSVADFLRREFFGPPARLALTLALVLALVLRGLAVPCNAMAWSLTLGFFARRAEHGRLLACVVFSGLSFAIFLFKFWGLSMLALWTRERRPVRTGHTLLCLARPFTVLPSVCQPIALLLFGMLLSCLLSLTGTEIHGAAHLTLTPPHPDAPAVLAWLVFTAKIGLTALSGWVEVLGVLQTLMIALLIGTGVATLAAAPNVVSFCREWSDLLLGPLRGYPLRVGPVELSPLVFIVALMTIQFYAQSILLAAFVRLP